MARYDYKCPECDYIEERVHSMKETLTYACPSCEHEYMEKVISGGSGFIFKGVQGSSGFYELDYRRPQKDEDERHMIKNAKKDLKELEKQGKIGGAGGNDIVTLNDVRKKTY